MEYVGTQKLPPNSEMGRQEIAESESQLSIHETYVERSDSAEKDGPSPRPVSPHPEASGGQAQAQ